MTSNSLETEIFDKNFFSEEELTLLDPEKIPTHVAIIPDGNRRWACSKSVSSNIGHWEGADKLTNIVKAAAEMGVRVLTVYSFSTENWTRSKNEIDALMKLFELYLISQRDILRKEGIRLNVIGDISMCPLHVQNAIKDTMQATEKGSKFDLVLAMNYGGRDEIKRSILKIIDDYDNNKIDKSCITENLISKYLDTAKWKDPDLLIRTSGEQRISNFLLWQISYTEVYVTDVLWPEFSPKHFYKAVMEYQKRKRRLGGI